MTSSASEHETRLLRADADDAIAAAVDVLQRRGVCAVPTETVYGLAGRGLDDESVRAIYAAKGRPADNPVILHVADVDDAFPLWVLSAVERRRVDVLARAFWPGPLTIVATASDVVPPVPRAGLSKVAVRVPGHPFARALARALGEPFAAPSANTSGRPSPTTALDVLETLNGRIPLVIDGGPCSAGIESSVVDVTGARPVLLRPGALSVLELRRVLPELDVRTPGSAAHVADASPGLRHRHYAPALPSALVSEVESVWQAKDVAVVVDRATASRLGPRAGFLAALPNDPRAYASELYAALYRAERAHPARLVIQQVADDDAWATVRDRLLRATA
ncbi:MAG: L-threonylcarbamoyladenylate synthase [Deltaproteobacteria bacterium]|nr:L-threonylcarbamoyladenylate synthase [Deltaproteobacteria bacterium]